MERGIDLMDPSNDARSGLAGAADAPLASIDSFPYRHRVGELMSAPAVIVDGRATLADALRQLTARKVSSLLVGQGTAAGDLGIFTERDVLRALEAHGPDALAIPLARLANRPLQAVQADDFVYRAIGRMDRLGLRHLAVRDASGAVVGTITTRNLLRHRASRAIVLGDEIDARRRRAALGAAWARLSLMAGSARRGGRRSARPSRPSSARRSRC